MFLNYFKNFYTKKIVKNNLFDVKNSTHNDTITTVGILFDETYSNEKATLVSEIIKNGIDKKNIKVLSFKDKINKNEVYDYPIYSQSDLNWSGKIDTINVEDFISESFDLLINYYEIEKVPLLAVSHLSKAKFKVGFSTVDNRLHHLIIETNIEKYDIFVSELFKYLKILNKI